jgi:alpha-beta hydrolase superfamily lysophospholipase
LWVNSFDDYVDDFVYFVTMVGKESPNHPIFLLAHSMGGLIGSMAMARCVTALSDLLFSQCNKLVDVLSSITTTVWCVVV